MSKSLALLDATAQAELVARGELKPIELVEAAIERILRVNPKLNAVIHPLFEKARAEKKEKDHAHQVYMRNHIKDHGG